jgi:hypothetical protein
MTIRILRALVVAAVCCAAWPGPGLSQTAEVDEPGLVWGRVEYLLWWRKPVCLKPPILTAGSPADAVPGAIGQPGTVLVLGQSKFEFPAGSGVRPAVGVWLLGDELLGLEVSGLYLQQGSNSRSFQTVQGNPPTFLPFQNPQNVQQALPFSIPGAVEGTSFACGTSGLSGVEASLLSRAAQMRSAVELSATFLVGYRFLELTDRVVVTQTQSLVADPSVQAVGSDTFTTRNQFHGAQVGCRLGLGYGDWSLEYRTSLAVGETLLVSQINGSPLIGPPVAAGLVPGPLLALASNLGEKKTTRISLVPELALTAHYRVGEYLSLSLGYNVLYWNKILCPGDQMDTHANLTLLPGRGPATGPAVPASPIAFTDFFAQGLTAGVELRY